jgi:hypothetical protein
MKLGFAVSEATLSRYMPRRPVKPNQVNRWLAFLRNHTDAITAMDLFTVLTASLRGLYAIFVIDHGPSARLAHQRHVQSDGGIGDPATTRGVSLRQREPRKPCANRRTVWFLVHRKPDRFPRWDFRM